MRLSDILKKSQQAAQQGQVPEPEKKPVEQKEPITRITKKEEDPKPLKEDTPAQNIETAASLQMAEESYNKAITDIKLILSDINLNYPPQIISLENLLEAIESRNDSMLILAGKSTPDVFLYGHCVNMCILSVLIGSSLKMPRSMLLNTAYLSFLNSFATLKKLKISVKDSKLSQNDLTAIKQHLPTGKDALDHTGTVSENIKAGIIDILKKAHDRNIYNKYTLETIKSEDIEKLTQILTIAYLYEALTHPANFQERIIPHEAIKTIISNIGDNFDPQLLKCFVERISIFPPGSYVRLNTEEIARVTAINNGLPTRPKVFVIIDSGMKKALKQKIVDLSATPMLFIKEAIDELKLELSDKKLSLELRAMRWWVRGI